VFFVSRGGLYILGFVIVILYACMCTSMVEFVHRYLCACVCFQAYKSANVEAANRTINKLNGACGWWCTGERYSDTVETWDTRMNKWHLARPLPRGRAYFGAVAF